MGRPARALLDTQALRQNYAVVRRHARNARVMAVIKANAYGHGITWVAGVLHDADAFAVASIEEAMQLRRAGVLNRVVVLEGFFGADEIPLFAQHHLSPVVHHPAQLAMLETATANPPLSVWLKVDTGMHRLGFPPEDIRAAYDHLKRSVAVKTVRLMSHLASSDETDNPETKTQIERFVAIHRQIPIEASLANSAGILAWPTSHYDWVRPGIMLYGATTLAGKKAEALDLKPVMTLASGLIAVHHRKRGDLIGYGGTYRCPEDMPVGIAAIGYGDGYPRHAKSGTPVLVNNMRVPIIGRVAMDMIAVDLRAQPSAHAGAPVTLWGKGLPVDEIAANAGTISYELLCHVAERIPRVMS